MYRILSVILGGVLLSTSVHADTVKLDVIKQPYSGSRNVPELSINPDYIHALANSNFAERVRETRADDVLTVGLEANCNGLLGMLAGLKYDGNGNEQRVGLVFIDAHGDFNVPETTLSGMLGGMPVAIAAGHALHNVRKTSGLAEGLPMNHILWGGVRDLDPKWRSSPSTMSARCPPTCGNGWMNSRQRSMSSTYT